MLSHLAMELEALYDAVFAAPEDDAPRLVLADALQEQGDPRGEFIALQLQQPRAQRSERRMAKLLERHRDAFLRRLHSVVMPDAAQRWERGFLTEASVVLRGDQVDTPDWATVRKLEVLFGGTPPLELASPHLRSLEEISLAPLEAVPVLFEADRPLGITAVALQGPTELADWPAPEVESIGRARSLPGLTRLTLRCHATNFTDAAWMWRMPVVERLRSLEFLGAFRTVPLDVTVARLRDAERAAANVVFQAAGVRLRLKREDQFRSLVIELVPSLGLFWIDTMFGSIPPRTFTEVVVTSVEPLTEGQLGMLQRTFKRLRIANVSLPGPAHSRMK